MAVNNTAVTQVQQVISNMMILAVISPSIAHGAMLYSIESAAPVVQLQAHQHADMHEAHAKGQQNVSWYMAKAYSSG